MSRQPLNFQVELDGGRHDGFVHEFALNPNDNFQVRESKDQPPYVEMQYFYGPKGPTVKVTVFAGRSVK